MPKKNIDEARNLAEKLSEWASFNGQIDDPYVSGLLNDLYKKKNLAMWATINPMEMLPYSKTNESNRKLNWGKNLGIARNILVFAPVGITWKGVEEATKAFSKFVENNSAATVNFLEFWQNGYGVLPDAWTIGNVARFDYLLIALIIILSIVTTALTERGKSLRAKNALVIEADRTFIAIEIQKYLFDKRAVSDITLNASLATAVQSLENSTKALEATTSKLENSSKKFPSDLSFRNEYRDFFNRLNKLLNKKESR